MITALLLRLGVARWLAWLALTGAVAGGALWYRHTLFEQGVVQGVAIDKVRSDKIIAAADLGAQTEQARINGELAALLKAYHLAVADLEKLRKEYDDEKAISNQRQLDLLAGRERLRVLTRPRASPVPQNGPPQSGTPADVDPAAGVVADLDPRAAAWIDGLRTERNAVVLRLNACVAEYDALATYVNNTP